MVRLKPIRLYPASRGGKGGVISRRKARKTAPASSFQKLTSFREKVGNNTFYP